MQFTNNTDYAIRLVIFLAAEGRRASTSEIAERMGIPFDYLRAVAAPLREAGLVTSHKGSRGGYELARAPERISLFDIVELTEGTTKINRCLEHDRFCNRFAAESCPVRSCYVHLQALIEGVLRLLTIDRVLESTAVVEGERRCELPSVRGRDPCGKQV